MKKQISIIVVLMMGTMALAACSSGKDAKSIDVPAAYVEKVNLAAGKNDSASLGQAVYMERCAACHGDSGRGDGSAAKSLSPAPAKLKGAAENLGDTYMFWRIAEGGAMDPFNSSMPAHQSVLSEDQIWQVVEFLKTLQ